VDDPPPIFRAEPGAEPTGDYKVTPMEALKRMQQQSGAFCPICKQGHPGAFVHGPEKN